MAWVKPVHKKKEKDKFENYRPISLLSNVNKIFEKLIFNRLIRFLEVNSILAEQQNGFRRGKSTMTAIYQALKIIINSLNNKQLTAALCLDLSKAFDSVDHSLLLAKMERYGIRGTVLLLFKSYLTDRKQRVTEVNIKGERILSNDNNIKQGVPQGSILGPLLYLLYTNEIVNISNDKIILFADDTNVIYSSNSVEECIVGVQRTMSDLSSWLTANNLLLNVSKTKLLMFGTQDHLNVTTSFNNDEIESVEILPFLGVIIDKKLDWKEHIGQLAGRVAGFCFALSVIRNNIGTCAALSSYHAFVQSRIRYGIIFWGNSVVNNRIFILQKRCIRTIFKIKQLETCRQAFIENNILSMYSLYIYECIMFVMNNYTFFEQLQYEHNYNTRH